MKIATIAYLHGFGGAEKQITLLSNALAEFGHDVTMIILAEFNKCYTISEKVSVIDLTGYEKKSAYSLFLRLRLLCNTLKIIRPEVSIHFNFQSAYFCVLLPKLYTGKVIYSERGDPYDKEYSGLMGLIRKFSLPYIDGFVFQSEGARDFFNKAVRKRSVIIHNPIIIRDGQYKRPNTLSNVIINVGRLHPQKNQKLLINAFKLFHRRFNDYKLHIYGDGELRVELLNLVNDLKLNDSVKIFSAQEGISEIISSVRMFVLSSDFEGMPNVLLEAMALGVPCISTDCRPGGARALIKDGVNGFITPAGDVKELANKMIRLISDIELQKQFSNACVEIIHSHSPEAIFNKWNKFVKTI